MNAQYSLGYCYYSGLYYEYGLEVRESYDEAAKWYARAAMQGHEGAQEELGFMFNCGFGVPRSDVEAAKWYAKASAQKQRTD
jgi:hypothetical protein